MKSAAHKPTGLVPINRRQSFALSSRSNPRVGGPLFSPVSSLLRELKSPVVALLSTFEILRDCAGERNTFHLRTVLQTEAPQIVLGLCLAPVHLEGDIFINLLVSNQFQTLFFFLFSCPYLAFSVFLLHPQDEQHTRSLPSRTVSCSRRPIAISTLFEAILRNGLAPRRLTFLAATIAIGCIKSLIFIFGMSGRGDCWR